MTIQIETPAYDSTKKGKPWIARVTFEIPEGNLHWGTFIGSSGEEGILLIPAEEEDVVATGQKDWESKYQGAPTFFRVREGGTLAPLVGRKDAWLHWQKINNPKSV